MVFRIAKFIWIFCVLLQLNVVLSAVDRSGSLESRLPRIEQPNYQLIPSKQQYTLVIDVPGGSTRTDYAELRAPNTPEQELEINGTITNNYPESLLVIMYKAGKYGYYVVYTYNTHPRIEIQSLSPQVLKSAAG